MAGGKSGSKDVVLDVCTKATLLGNKISVRMLEYLSTVKNYPLGFDLLAQEFLDICRILWSIEAGLNDFSRTNQRLPPEMMAELERKFKATYVNFQGLDQMLFRFLEYEKKGALGKFQKGWRSMFADNGIDKMRESLAKSTEALRMSALVFQWSLGNAKVDESVGIGYTGLAAALDRMNKGRSVAGIAKVKSLEQMSTPLPKVDEHSLPALPPLPPMSMTDRHDSAKDLDINLNLRSPAEPSRRASISQRTVSSYRRERVNSPNGSFENHSSVALGRDVPQTPSFMGHAQSHLSQAPSTAFTSVTQTESDTLADELASLHTNIAGGTIKVTRVASDPASMPRWTPRNTVGANTAALKSALIGAVQESNHGLIEQLLDRGVSPDTTPEFHVLNDAILHEDLETIRLLLLFGADPNTGDKASVTPLLLAAQCAFLEGATWLLKYGADANLPAGPEHESPLATAVTKGNLELTHVLLTYGGDSKHIASDGNPILIKSISKSAPIKLVDMLLEYGADANGKSREGESPLFRSIQSSRVDIVTSLLDHGANPNLPGPKHMLWPATYQTPCLKMLLARGADTKKTPGIMELASSINNIDSVRVLLEAGVDPNIKKDGTYTPLCTSIRDDHPDIFKLLLSSGADPNVPAAEYPAWKCVTHFRPQYLPPLIEAGADLHHPPGILEQAVMSNNREALVFLLDHGVNPNDRNAQGHTPLTTAIRENRTEVVDLLLSRGASPSVRGEDWPVCMAVRQPALLSRLLPHLSASRNISKGVMELAVKAGQLESVKLLLAAGVSVEDKNGGVFSPLTTALREDRKDIVRFLLSPEGGADPNAPGEHLPIVKAVRRYHNLDTDMIELLLDCGADPNKTYRGWNAVMQAIENGDARVLRLLLKKGGGVDLSARDDNDRTVWDLATTRGWDEAVTILQEFPQRS